MTRLIQRLLASAVLSISVVAATVGASYGQDKVVRIGFQKYGKLVLLKSKGTLEEKLKADGYKVVWTEFPSGPPLLEALNVGAIDFGNTGEAPPIFAQAAGAPIQYVAYEPPAPKGEAILVPKDSKLNSVADLKGKTVATAGIPYQDAFLKTILARVQLSPDEVKSVNVGFGLLPALVGGSAQAMLGGYSNVEGVDLRERGKAPVVTPVDQLGVPTYDDLVFVTSREKLRTSSAATRARCGE